LFGIKDDSAEAESTAVPDLVKPSAGKVRLRKKAPRKKKEEPKPEEAEAEAVEGAEAPAAAEEATEAPEKEAPSVEAEKKAPAEAKAEREAEAPAEEEAEAGEDGKAKTPRKKKAARPEKPGTKKGPEEIAEEESSSPIPAEALRKLSKAEHAGPPRPRRGGRRRSDRPGRGRRGIPEKSRAHKGKVASTAPPKPPPRKKFRIQTEQTLGELAFALDVATEKLEEVLKAKGRRDLTPLTVLTVQDQVDVGRELEYDVEAVTKEPKLEPRRAVVAVLGHVDHGKTTLLDAVRKTNVVATESGGITQHVGASVVEGKFGEIVFIDTPGHEAFTQMRARGTQVTDIVILVVAADDGVMPQTLESISHAKAGHVPLVVAITKMDKAEADPLRVKRGLAEHGVTTEDWGGEVLSAEIPAVKGEGLDKLLEAVSLQAEIMELKEDPRARATGVVIESTLDRGRGAVITVLVQRGTLKVGDSFVAGQKAGRVRAMFDTKGRKVKEAGPSTPVSILGVEGVPDAGDVVVAMPDDKVARSLAALLAVGPEEEAAAEPAFSLDDWYRQLQEGGQAELNLVVKADVAGSAEALVEQLGQLGNDEVATKMLHAGVGAVTEGDVLLASTSQASLIAYRVGVEAKARTLAQREGVEIRNYDVIYETIEEVRAALEGLLEPEIVTQTVGTVEVRQVFAVSSSARVAGCMVTSGRAFRGAGARILRDGVVIHEGTISSLRRFRDDVKEVQQGLECGVMVSGFSEIEEGDVIEVLEERKIARRLDSK